MTVGRRTRWFSGLLLLTIAGLTLGAQPVRAELNDTLHSWFVQAPGIERLDVTGTAGDSQLVVSWSPVTQYSGPKDILYIVDVQSSGYSSNSFIGRGGCTVTTPSRATGRPSCVISGLENGRTYYVHLTAAAVEEVNLYNVRPLRVGGDMGNPAVVTLCCTRVGPVSQIQLTDNGEGRGTVSWVQPQDTGGSTDLQYAVTVDPGGMTCSTSDTSCLVTGLRPNTSYTATVTASNRDFAGPPSTSGAIRIPPESPEAPSRVKARLTGAKVFLTWKPPANADAADVTAYVIRSTPRGLTCTPKRRTTCTVAGLKPGVSYSFQVRATGSAKAGAYSRPTPPVTRPVPPPPPEPAPAPAPAPAPTSTPKPAAPVN